MGRGNVQIFNYYNFFLVPFRGTLSDSFIERCSQVARNYYEMKYDSKTAIIIDTLLIKHKEKKLYYSFNFQEGGFVYVATDYNNYPVPTSSRSGRLTEEIIPWMLSDEFLDRVYKRHMDKKKTDDYKYMWDKIIYKQKKSKSGNISQFLQTRWEQGPDYKKYNLCVGKISSCVIFLQDQDGSFLLRSHHPCKKIGNQTKRRDNNVKTNYAESAYNCKHWNNVHIM